MLAQYTNITINAGATLVVPSSTVLRATGTFSNAGTIIVSPSSPARFVTRPLLVEYPGGMPLQYRGGVALSDAEALGLVSVAQAGGTAGGSNGTRFGEGLAGGALAIRALGGISNTGTIRADGGDVLMGTGGGGAGGLLILMSKGPITSPGTILARGGKGSDGRVGAGWGGGGGGGGLVRVLGPMASTVAADVSGGAAGTPNPSYGGGGGGRRPRRRRWPGRAGRLHGRRRRPGARHRHRDAREPPVLRRLARRGAPRGGASPLAAGSSPCGRSQTGLGMAP